MLTCLGRMTECAQEAWGERYSACAWLVREFGTRSTMPLAQVAAHARLVWGQPWTPVLTCMRRELGAGSAEVLAEMRYDLPATMCFHKWVPDGSSPG